MTLIDDAKRPTPAREPLRDNPRRRYGPQSSALTVCAKHGEAYPSAEACPYCLTWLEQHAAGQVEVRIEDQPWWTLQCES